MIEITTIAAFQALPEMQRVELVKCLKVKDRLEAWLLTLNGKKSTQKKNAEAHWEPCKSCRPDYPGWKWVEPDRDDRDLHPSTIAKCLKLQWYACTGKTGDFEEFVDPRLRMIFDIGHAWHRTMQMYGAQGAWGDPSRYQSETPIDRYAKGPDGSPVHPIAERYWIRGHADALVYDIVQVPSMGGPVLVKLVHEYKTINSGNFSKLTSAKPEHKKQATVYSACLDAPIVVYLYTNKDNCSTVDYPVAFDNALWNELTQKVDKVQYFVNAQQMPPWEETAATLNPAECMECAARKFCQPPMRRR